MREKKLDTDEVSAEIQKGIEDLKKTIDRLKAREKQIVKDAQQTELEVQQFQLQKQAALNQISVVVPLRISQIHMFETSGNLTGPTDKTDGSDQQQQQQHYRDPFAAELEDLPASSSLQQSSGAENNTTATAPQKCCLVPNIDLKSHTLFSSR